jgi:hypothetical protein
MGARDDRFYRRSHRSTGTCVSRLDSQSEGMSTRVQARADFQIAFVKTVVREVLPIGELRVVTSVNMPPLTL